MTYKIYTFFRKPLHRPKSSDFERDKSTKKATNDPKPIFNIQYEEDENIVKEPTKNFQFV